MFYQGEFQIKFCCEIASTCSQPLNFAVAYLFMGENFQDYSWIQDSKADFPQKVGLKIQI